MQDQRTSRSRFAARTSGQPSTARRRGSTRRTEDPVFLSERLKRARSPYAPSLAASQFGTTKRAAGDRQFQDTDVSRQHAPAPVDTPQAHSRSSFRTIRTVAAERDHMDRER